MPLTEQEYDRLTKLIDLSKGCTSNLSYSEMKEYLVLSNKIDDFYS